MSNPSTATASPADALAAALYSHKTGLSLTFQDNVPASIADFSISDEQGEVGLLEVTAALNSPMLQLGKALTKHNRNTILIPGSSFYWTVVLIADLNPQAKPLAKALPLLLREIEVNLDETCDLPILPREQYPPETHRLFLDLADLGIGLILGNKVNPTVGIATIHRGEYGGFAMEVSEAVELTFDSQNIEKLRPATSVGKIGVLFVWIDRLHPAARTMWDQTGEAVVDRPGPDLPSEISEVWAVHTPGLNTGLIWIWDGSCWRYDTWSEIEIRALNPDLPPWGF